MQQGSKNRKLRTQVLATLKNEVEVALHATKATEPIKAAIGAATGAAIEAAIEAKEKEEAETKRTIAPKLQSILL
jgi:hypothetical protein